jgi:acyl carrier protein
MPASLDALRVVRDAVVVVCEVEPESVTAETRLDELGADSLARVSIADTVESAVAEQAGRVLHIDDAALAAMVTVREFADYVAAAG